MPPVCPPATADTNRTSLHYVIEDDACWGATPDVGALAPKGFELRMTGETLVHNKQTIVSESIRTDRMRDTISEVGASVEGDLNFELSFRDWEAMLQGALANDFEYIIERTMLAGDVGVTGSTNRYDVLQGTVDFENFVIGADVHVAGFELNTINNGRMLIVTVDAADQFMTVNNEVVPVTTLTDEDSGSGLPLVFKTPKGIFTDLEVQSNDGVGSGATDFLVDLNLAVGQTIRMERWDVTGNNGVFKIAALTANLMTLTTVAGANPALTIETAGTVILTAQRLKNGKERKSFLLQKLFGDITQYFYMTGCRVGQMTLNTEAQALVTGSFSFQGKEGISQQTSVLGSEVPAGIKDALNATTNVGNISEAGVPLSTAIRSIELTIANNLRPKPQLGSRSPVDIGYGFIDITGTAAVYFEDAALLAKFIAHTSSSLAFTFTDSDGNVLVITIPRLFFTTGSPMAPGGNDDVILSMEFTAVRNVVDDAVIIIDALPAAI